MSGFLCVSELLWESSIIHSVLVLFHRRTDMLVCVTSPR